MVIWETVLQSGCTVASWQVDKLTWSLREAKEEIGSEVKEQRLGNRGKAKVLKSL